MGLPAEPRQKMINMMYLVLTALLALNVSSEILNAFKTVNNSLTHANEIVDEKNKLVMESFADKVKDPQTHDQAIKWQPLADQAQKLSEETFQYLESLKQELKQDAGLTVENGEEHFKEDNLDVPTKLFLEAPKRKGPELYSKLKDFKDKLLGLDPEVAKTFATSLPLDLEVPKTHGSENSKEWDYAYFHMTPVIASITILSKFQNDVRNSEAMVLDELHKRVGSVKIVYDQFQAITSQSSQYLMPNQELVITGGIGAFSKAAAPTVTIDGATIPLNADGVAEYKETVKSTGSFTKKMVVSFVKPNGEKASVSKDIIYTVGSPTGASVSADKVKVLYLGLENDLSVSGGNVGDEKVSVSMTNGRLEKKGAGKYVAHPEAPGSAKVTVTADGKSTDFEFKVKTVPNPIGKIGNMSGGRVPANTLKAQAGVRADLENFVFDGVQFNVISYVVYGTGAGFSNPAFSQNSGAVFSAQSKGILNRLVPSSTLVIDELKAVGPDGKTRTLPPLVFNCTQ